ncbi:MAG TPA: CoA transferase [Arthrobacter sp.]|nr:CoA transferase [Arthrobacter sp.]
MLDGVRILDLTQFLSGPFGSQILADLGADVIKIEPPHGDAARTVPPHFFKNDSLYFHAVNRGKRSVQIDLKSDRGRDAFLQMVTSADVVFDNFRAGVMGSLGLSRSVLQSYNPKLVTCSINGFGERGQYSARPAYDVVVQAMSGGMSLTGRPEEPPVRMGLPIGDLAAGMYAATGIVAALLQAEHTGRGDHIEVAMLDCQLALLTYQAAYYLGTGEVPEPQGSGHVSIPTYRAFECQDGRYVLVAANTERMWESLCQAIGGHDLLEDPRFKTEASRLRHKVELWARLEELFLSGSAETMLDRLLDARVPSARVSSVAEALDDPNTEARGMLVHLHSPDGGEVVVTGNPIRSAHDLETGFTNLGFPPSAGRDTLDVLGEAAGLSHGEIRELHEERIIGPYGDERPSGRSEGSAQSQA